MQSMVPLMLVPLLVWVAFWIYVWSLDMRVRKLAAEIERRSTEDDRS